MKINLKLNTKPVMLHPYRLNPNYKEKVCKEFDKMPEVGIIKPTKESYWVSPMVVMENKRKVKFEYA